jgi:hypothetical protein
MNNSCESFCVDQFCVLITKFKLVNQDHLKHGMVQWKLFSVVYTLYLTGVFDVI